MAGRSSDPPEQPTSDDNTDPTAVLLARARNGNGSALATLVARYLPVLRGLAHGRLPSRARGATNTSDLVQITALRALNRIDRFEFRGDVAFLAYMRQILINEIRDEIRRSSKLGEREELTDDFAQAGPTPLEEAIGRQTLAAYEAALSRLTSRQREALILRLELGFEHAQVAEALDLPSANAARLLVARAVRRLATHLRSHQDVE